MSGFNDYGGMIAELQQQTYEKEKTQELVDALTVHVPDLVVALFNVHCMPSKFESRKK